MSTIFGGFLLADPWSTVVVGSARAWSRYTNGGLVVVTDEGSREAFEVRGGAHVLPLFFPYDVHEGPSAEEEWVVVAAARKLVTRLAGGVLNSHDVALLGADDVPLVAIWLSARLLCDLWGIGGEDALAYLRGHEAVTARIDQRFGEPVPPRFLFPSDVLADTWFERDLLTIERKPDNLLATYVPWVRDGMIRAEAWARVNEAIESPDVEHGLVVERIEAIGRGGVTGLLRELQRTYMQQPKIEQDTFFEWLPDILEKNPRTDVFANPAMIFWFGEGLQEWDGMKIFRYAVAVIGNAYWKGSPWSKERAWAPIRKAVSAWLKRMGATQPSEVKLVDADGMPGLQGYLSTTLGLIGARLGLGSGWMWKLSTVLELDNDIRAAMSPRPPPSPLLVGLRSLMAIEEPPETPRRGRQKR